MIENINFVAVIVSAIFASAIGSIWYSPLLFGAVWMKSIGLTLEKGELSKKEMMIATWKGVCIHIALFFIIALYLDIVKSTNYSIIKIIVSLIVLLSVGSIQSVVWERRPFTYFLIQSGYIALIVMSGVVIISLWPW